MVAPLSRNLDFTPVSLASTPRTPNIIPFWESAGWASAGDLAQDWPPWMLITIGPWGPFVGFPRGQHGDKEIGKITTTGDSTPVSRSGRYPSDVQVELWIWRQAEYDMYCQMIPGIYRLKAVGTAVRVSHPALQIITGVGSMALSFRRADILQAPLTGGKAITHLHFSEWISPITTPPGSSQQQNKAASGFLPNIPSPETFANLTGLPLSDISQMRNKVPNAMAPPTPTPPSATGNNPSLAGFSLSTGGIPGG